MSEPSGAVQKTGLTDLQVAKEAKTVAFASYEIPVQYFLGVLKESLPTRELHRHFRRVARGTRRNSGALPLRLRAIGKLRSELAAPRFGARAAGQQKPFQTNRNRR